MNRLYAKDSFAISKLMIGMMRWFFDMKIPCLRRFFERVDLLKQTALNASATHGLYEDPEFRLEKIMDRSMKTPLIESEDYQGVRERLSVINDPEEVQQFLQVLEKQKVILADGHHRYQGSIDYRKHCTLQNPEHNCREGYNYHMMFLSNMEAKDLRILATHRLIKDISGFSIDNFLSKASEYFEVTEVDTPFEINEIILGKRATFGVLLKDRSFRFSLKPGLAKTIKWPFPDMIKQLDLTILHYFILEKLCQIPGREQRNSTYIDYDRNFTDCVAHVNQGQVQMAVITNEVTMEEVKKVCFSGYTLPQKSTYFYPRGSRWFSFWFYCGG